MTGKVSRAVALAFSILLGASPAAASAAWLDSSQLRSVDAVFKSYGSKTPGCALGIFHDDAIAYAHGYGMADLERGFRITPESLFDVGSVSKQFSAAAIVLLADEGKLSLNDDVRKYIPEMRDYGAPITLNELMWHTSGLRDYTDLLDLAGYGLEQVTTDDEALSAIVRQRGLEFPSGTQYEYSNTNYFLLSVIVKRVTGKTLAQFVGQNIFNPLSMTHTMYRTDYAMLIPDRAMGYGPAGDGQFKNSMSNWQQTGDGGVQLSVDDAFRWDENFYHPKVGGARMVDQLQTPGHLANGKRLDYARGLFVGSYRRLRLISHGGAWIGYRAEIDRYPTVHTSIAILCNSDVAHPSVLAQQVADVVLKPFLGPLSAGKPEAAYTHPIEPQYLTGAYFDPIGGDVYHVSGHGSTVELELGGNSYPLRATGRSSFVLGSTRVGFVIGNDGYASALTLDGGGESNVMATKFVQWKPSASELSGASADYYSPELDVTWRLRTDGQKLSIEPTRNLPDGAAGALQPQVRDTFTDDGGGFAIRLNRDNTSAIEGFTLIGGRGLRSLEFTKRPDAKANPLP